MPVCLSLFACLSHKRHPNCKKFSVHVTCGRGSILQCTLCTSSFVDDIVFARNGTWLTERILKVTHQGAELWVKSWRLQLLYLQFENNVVKVSGSEQCFVQVWGSTRWYVSTHTTLTNVLLVNLGGLILFLFNFWATVCKTVCPMLSDRYPVSLSVLTQLPPLPPWKVHSKATPPLFGLCLLWPRSPISATAELLFSLLFWKKNL